MINIDLLVSGNAFLVGMTNHLWQSTLFAASIWLITLFMKGNHARIRYWTWFSVSIKFLIPFSLIVNMGSMLAPELSRAQVEISPAWNLIQTISEPFNLQELKEVSSTSDIADSFSLSDSIPILIFYIWLCGCFTVFLNRLRLTLRVAGMVRNAEYSQYGPTVKMFQRIRRENRVSDTVRLAFTRKAMEPGVFGVFRPVLLLPTAISGHINDEELETIILHEFAHIRYKDNFTALIHIFAESLFWFHPLVWYTGARLIFERELACDEFVLQSGKNPRTYAKGLLKVCELYFKSPLSCVPGVIGSDLKKRMGGILKKKIGCKLSPAKKIFLSVAGLSVLTMPLLIGIVNAPSGRANYSTGTWANPPVEAYTSNEYPVAIEPEKNDTPAEMINGNDDKSTPPAIDSVSMPVDGQSPYREKSTEAKPSEEQEESSFKAAERALKVETVTDARGTVNSGNVENSIAPVHKEIPAKAAASVDNSGIEPEAENADTFVYIGVSYFKKEQFKDAISEFDKAIDLDRNKAVAYVARGSAYYRLGLLDSAISDYNKAIAIDPDFAVAYQNRGSAYYSQGKFGRALSDYNRAIAINPGLTVTYHDRGSIYHSQNKFDEAISDYSKAIDLNPGFAVAYQNRGSAYYSTGMYKKAVADYNRAIELNPELGKTNDDEEIACRLIAPTGSNIGNKICLTKAQWAVGKKDNGYLSIIAFK